MILPVAYMLYSFFKRFPIVVVLLVFSHSCLFHIIEKEIGAEEEIEIEAKLICHENNIIKEEPCLGAEFQVKKSVFAQVGKIQKNGSTFIKSAYYKLCILYLNLSIDKKLVLQSSI